MAEEKKKRVSGNKGKRTNRALAHWRTLQVYRELKAMKSATEIKAKFSSEWVVSERTVQNYITKANKAIRADYDVDRHEMLLQLMHSYQHVFEESLKSKQHSDCLGALNALSRITRIDPGVK